MKTLAQGANFAAVTVGQFDELGEHVFTIAPGIEIPGKVFVGADLGCSGAELSFQTVPGGGGGDFLHTHKTNEELYIVSKGSGEFQVDGHIFPVAEGSVVRVSPDGKRAWRNTGSDPMVMLCIQVKSQSLDGLGIGDGNILSEPVKW